MFGCCSSLCCTAVGGWRQLRGLGVYSQPGPPRGVSGRSGPRGSGDHLAFAGNVGIQSRMLVAKVLGEGSHLVSKLQSSSWNSH
jgi:hypothetical protein